MVIVRRTTFRNGEVHGIKKMFSCSSLPRIVLNLRTEHNLMQRIIVEQDAPLIASFLTQAYIVARGGFRGGNRTGTVDESVARREFCPSLLDRDLVASLYLGPGPIVHGCMPAPSYASVGFVVIRGVVAW